MDLHFIHKKGWLNPAPLSEHLIETGMYHPLHTYKGFEIHKVIKGSYEWRIDDRKFHVYPGNA